MYITRQCQSVKYTKRCMLLLCHYLQEMRR